MTGPSGTVTFLFTDIEGSTRLWQEDETSMPKAVARHNQMLRAAVTDHGGAVFSTMGDGLAAAFQTASAAVSCAIEGQRFLDEEAWDTVRPIKVGMRLHTGEVERRDDDHFGTAVNRAARLGDGRAWRPDRLLLLDGRVSGPGDSSRRSGRAPLAGSGPADACLSGRGWPLSAPVAECVPGEPAMQLTSFVGRPEELASVAKALEGFRLVTLTGTGGVGKTRLAGQVADQDKGRQSASVSSRRAITCAAAQGVSRCGTCP
jgi:hypothetical protein